MNAADDNPHAVVVIGGSAGGVEALRQVVADLPADLPAPLFVTLHIPATVDSRLPEILARAGQLAAQHPLDGGVIRAGMIYVAPPDHHLHVERGHVRIVRGPRENGQRPSLDPMFRSAAHAYGRGVIGVVVSGTLDDGTAGLLAVKRHRGLAIVQDPATALFSGMPGHALEHVDVDHTVPVEEIGALIARLATSRTTGARTPMTDHDPAAPQRPGASGSDLHDDAAIGSPSGFSCPDCNGVLWEIEDGRLLRFRCRIGHGYSVNSLLAAQSSHIEATLSTTLRSLEESAGLSRRLSARAREQGHELVAVRFEGREAEARRRIRGIRAELAAGGITDSTATAVTTARSG